VGSIIGDPFAIHGIDSGAERKRRVQDLMDLVGLNPEHYNRFPAEFSGGQRQRIGVARALALRPKLIVCDEPVSALDVSIQAQIINLLAELQSDLGLTYLFISHDLSVVHHIADRVAVMYLGHLVELGPKRVVYRNPLHPYTQALIAAVPTTTERSDANGRARLTGEIPSPIDVPELCRFSTRCPRVLDHCRQAVPRLEEVERDHYVACFNHRPVER
jgi:peptide/nickel transport system ATP-binding protein